MQQTARMDLAWRLIISLLANPSPPGTRVQPDIHQPGAPLLQRETCSRCFAALPFRCPAYPCGGQDLFRDGWGQSLSTGEVPSASLTI